MEENMDIEVRLTWDQIPLFPIYLLATWPLANI